MIVAKVIAGISEIGHFSKFNLKLSPQFSWDHPEIWQALTRHNLEQKPPARIFT